MPNINDIIAQRLNYVLFQSEYEEDIWDDTDLIAAYDLAIDSFKARVGLQEGSAPPQHGPRRDYRSSYKGRSKRRKSKSNDDWQIGSKCFAVFSEDGETYEAVISSIDRENGTCVVTYTGYGNNEEQYLSDLISSANEHEYPEEMDAYNNDGRKAYSEKGRQDMNYERYHESSSNERHNERFSKYHSQYEGMKIPSFNERNMPPPPPPMSLPPFGSMPPIPPFAMNIPAPPLPSIPPSHPGMFSKPARDDEELKNMLLSWYMSGYHTGYYQGLREGRRE
ncbi:DgyrCDS7274 [Dimorphilus gyrociliatus]|uniref:DgyrCDS7274 n=1 Tax=Dimorphilus gyrociliatus TaxID=2664684 RepID=A0A7I8VQJ0_9ANNE|nr:DgyrCDS7274 [Dimorphilus gyrociliatus]